MPIIIEMREEKPAPPVLEENEVIEVKENIKEPEIIEDKPEIIKEKEPEIIQEKPEVIEQEPEVIEVKENITQCEEKIVEVEEKITIDEEEIEYQPTTPPPSNNPLFVEPTDFVLDDIYTNYADDDL